MKPQCIKELYADLKRRHGSKTLLFFRVNEYLEAYFDDAAVIAGCLGIPLETNVQVQTQPQFVIRFFADKQEEYSNRLINGGYAIHIFQNCDSDGNYKVEHL